MIHWKEYPLNVVSEILLHDFNTGKKIFDGDTDKIIPRAQKSVDEKILRTRSIAEVFTPVTVVKFMVDNLELENIFWQNRVESKCLEVACGEAPFITTRYDAESGEEIPAAERVGILDRKFQAIPKNVVDKFGYAVRAVQSCYGYELQADSLLIARANVLLSFVDFVGDCSVDELRDVAEIISKNFWLMDGLDLPDAQGSLFAVTNEIKIVDWFDDKREIFFTGGNAMKFDFLISNPPYQDDTNAKGFAPPLYDKFMDAAPKIADKSVLITPARFLFDAGATPKEFNRRMLNNPHLKVLDYAPDARKYFRNVDIEGGVVVTIQDTTKNFGAIGTFIPWDELRSASEKVITRPDFKPLNEIVYSQKSFKLNENFCTENPDMLNYFKIRSGSTIGTNFFVELSKYFFDDKPDDGREYIRIIGKFGTARVYRWVRRDYVNAPEPLYKWKVFVPEANGASGKIVENESSRIISTPVVGEPNEGCTETFITIGAFDTRDEAENCLTYIKSKFARVMLGILKATQHATPATWAKVPLQDFSASSDIDWSGDVDGQLYRKYNLSDAEINFIETHVKEMP